MKYSGNIRDLGKLPIDFMGLIFYPGSARYIGNPEAEILKHLPDSIKRVGVFVDENPEIVKQKITQYNLNLVQLHGLESVDYCSLLRKELPVVKVFNISEASDFIKTDVYDGVCSYFLFDTKTALSGGSGVKFDWNLLSEYKGETPFFLSGGISVNDIDEIKKIKHPKLYGLDLNSRFETAPGIKDTLLISNFIKEIRL